MARNIARFEPMNEIMRSGMVPDIGNLFREFSLSPMLRGMELEPRMKIDVEEAGQNYVVRADVPGVKKEDISIDINGAMVSIRTEARQEHEEKGKNMLRSERYFGEEYRSFSLPQEVDEAKAEAKYDNGVLTLTLPKKAGGGGKKITVQ